MADPPPEESRSAAVNPLRHQPQGIIGLILVLAVVLVIAYFASHGWPWAEQSQSSAPAAPSQTSFGVVDPSDGALDAALSEPVEDSVYPEVGDPGVDALHYLLRLEWQPGPRTLTGTAVITLRSTVAAESFQLDLIPQLEVAEVRFDGQPVVYAHEGKDLTVAADLAANSRHRVEISYAGTPRGVEAPTRRSDIGTLGWHTTESGETWTMQEPFGAYSWYPVNDQPADKAFYDFELRVPAPMVGVANGELISRRQAAGLTTTRWHLAEPASSYLVTTAFGAFELETAVSDSGVPLSWWTPAADRGAADLAQLPELLAWAEAKLGPYPFDTLGLVLVDSQSAMETQTMMTLGNNPFIRSPEIVLHELIHQWYGNQVGPRDWRDVWMNEGMTMYLQGVWEAEQQGITVAARLRDWARVEPGQRRQSGPPGDYDPERFGDANVYYGPALMWHELSRVIGQPAFDELVRAWPAAHDSGALSGSADREDYFAWIEQTTGRELSEFFEVWIMGKRSPLLG